MTIDDTPKLLKTPAHILLGREHSSEHLLEMKCHCHHTVNLPNGEREACEFLNHPKPESPRTTVKSVEKKSAAQGQTSWVDPNKNTLKDTSGGNSTAILNIIVDVMLAERRRWNNEVNLLPFK